jgi:hypothetical protein
MVRVTLNATAAAAAAVIALLAAGCGGSDDSKTSSSTAAQQTASAPTTSPTVHAPETPTQTVPSEPPPASGGGSSGRGYSPTFKSAFVDTCARRGRFSRPVCQCIIDKAESQYQRRAFIRAVQRARRGAIAPKLRRIFFSCLSG